MVGSMVSEMRARQHADLAFDRAVSGCERYEPSRLEERFNLPVGISSVELPGST